MNKSLVKKILGLIMAIILLVGITGCGGSEVSNEETAYASGTTIRLIVPYKPGGGYDVEARMNAPYFQKYIEELTGAKVNIIVENLAGGAGAVATTQVYKEKTDGTVLFLLDPESSIWQQLMHNANFDIREFVYIGQTSADPLAFILSKEHMDVTSFDEIRQKSASKPFLLATAGFGGHDHMYSLLLQAFLEDKGMSINFTYLHEEGTGPIISNFRRKEIDGTIETVGPFLELIKEKEAGVMFTFTKEKTPLTPNDPTIFDRTEFDKLTEDELTSLVNMANYRRVLVMPPGTEEAKAKVMTEAVQKALTDPELIKKTEDTARFLTFISAEEIKNIINSEWEIASKYLDSIKGNIK